MPENVERVKLVDIFVVYLIMTGRLQMDADALRSQKRFFSVLWLCLTVGQMENKTGGNCGSVTNDSTE